MNKYENYLCINKNSGVADIVAACCKQYTNDCIQLLTRTNCQFAINCPITDIFIIGAVFGVFAMFGRLLRLRSQVNQLQAKLDKQIKAAAQAVHTENLATTATQSQSGNSDQKKVNN